MWPFLNADGARETQEVIKWYGARVVCLSAAEVDLDLDEQETPIHQFHAARRTDDGGDRIRVGIPAAVQLREQCPRVG